MSATLALLSAFVLASGEPSGSGSMESSASVYEYHDSSIFAIVTVLVLFFVFGLFIQGLRGALCQKSTAEEVSEEGVSAV